MSWVNEAHWAMGGLACNVDKLRSDRDKLFSIQNRSPVSKDRLCSGGSGSESIAERKRAASDSPPPAPITMKRRRYMALSDDDAEGEGEIEIKKRRDLRMLVKKLEDDFDGMASENDVSETGNEGENGRSKRVYDDDDGLMKLAEKVIERNSDEKGSQIQGNKNTVSASGVPDCIA